MRARSTLFLALCVAGISMTGCHGAIGDHRRDRQLVAGTGAGTGTAARGTGVGNGSPPARPEPGGVGTGTGGLAGARLCTVAAPCCCASRTTSS